MSGRKAFVSLAAAVALSAGALFSSIGVVSAGIEGFEICHATAAEEMPYVTNMPADEGQLEGHFEQHQGPIFNAADPQDVWGDIIPPFGEGALANGLNWTDAGQAIFNNDCEIPFGDVSVHKTVVDPGGVANPAQVYSITLVCTLDETVILEETVELTAGQTSDPFIDVQGGAHCDATEETAGIANLVSATSDGPVTVVDDEEVTVTITNTFAVPVVQDDGPEPQPAGAVRGAARFTG